MAFEKPYQHQPSAIASYNYTDLAEGTGVVSYYGFSTTISGATTFKLHPNTIYASTDPEISGAITTSGAASMILDKDFDLSPYNLPQRIRGTAIFMGCIGAYAPGGYETTPFLKVKLRKWDGTTETEIVDATSASVNASDGGGINNLVVTMPLTIPETLFKKGETLRCTCEVWGSKSATAEPGIVYLGKDPMNRDGEAIIPSTDDPESTTQMILYVPYDIDI